MNSKQSRGSIVWAAVLAFGILLSACGGASQPSASSGVKEGSETPVLTFWAALNGNASSVVKSLDDIPMVKEWQRRTNVDFQFIHPVSTSNSDVMQQFNVMLASNELPDVMQLQWTGIQGGAAKMYNDGTIMKLNDLIEAHAPNLKKIIDEYPSIAKQLMADNGDIYVFPDLKVGEYGKYKTFAGLMIRQDWLDELGLPQPETVDEWETVLRTIKEKKGIIPFTANKNRLFGTKDSSDFLGAYGLGQSFYVDNGKVKYGPMEPRFKDYLVRMQSWYKEGLIDPDYATNDSKLMDSRVSSGQAAAFFGYIGSSMGTYVPALQQADPAARLAAVQFPVLNKGEKPLFVPAQWEFTGIGAVLSATNKHPEETIKALDYLFSPEGSMLKNFGIEGETYTLENGQPIYTDLILNNPDNLSVSQAMAKYFIANYSFIGPADDRYNDQYYTIPEQKEAIKRYAEYADNAYRVMMPPVSLTTEEADEFGSIMNDIETYRSEFVTKIIMGSEPVASFDTMVAQFEKMKIGRAIEIQQAALDRYNSR
ncbi:sugar ABC transporter permease [Paenibacillus faecis]|uniref:Extracellular solute-binding protein n=1 Tax=Paenibacillus faecis TaxID=862114 RepID=A0A5D0CZH0_9BACL|nr:extracellular solute-binding protein [Paenibacillus faecis]TYA14724.1 extracellular solute-binding protein [Paenibacillus faecis]GIO84229.1 sugar ABC transporter permease [Paenibacillus faecis]